MRLSFEIVSNLVIRQTSKPETCAQKSDASLAPGK